MITLKSDTGYSSEATVDAQGVIRWVSNNRVPFDDLLAFNGISIKTREQCRMARNAENEAFMAEYRASRERTGYSREEIFEMRAAFGSGAKVVDVITGKDIQL